MLQSAELNWTPTVLQLFLQQLSGFLQTLALRSFYTRRNAQNVLGSIVRYVPQSHESRRHKHSGDHIE